MKFRLFPNELSKKKKSNNLAPMRLHAYVFCDCLEQGRLKRQPPNPEIVGVIANSDLGYASSMDMSSTTAPVWATISIICRDSSR